jgi:hypothetical protein
MKKIVLRVDESITRQCLRRRRISSPNAPSLRATCVLSSVISLGSGNFNSLAESKVKNLNRLTPVSFRIRLENLPKPRHSLGDCVVPLATST